MYVLKRESQENIVTDDLLLRIVMEVKSKYVELFHGMNDSVHTFQCTWHSTEELSSLSAVQLRRRDIRYFPARNGSIGRFFVLCYFEIKTTIFSVECVFRRH